MFAYEIIVGDLAASKVQGLKSVFTAGSTLEACLDINHVDFT